MSTNRLSHLKEGEKIYLEVTRIIGMHDDNDMLLFQSDDWNVYVSDNDTFYALDDLKTLANDGMPNGNMPKQGEMIEVLHSDGVYSTTLHEFVAFYKGCVVVVSPQYGITRYDGWRFPRKKTELTLAEVEKRLGLDTGSLIIK